MRVALQSVLASVRDVFASPPPLPPPSRSEPPAAGGSGVPREVLRQVRLIELRTRGLVESLFGGEYNSVFKGQGMEFSEVREYQPGDDVRHIDWNVTARMAHPYVKKHKEERELTVLLAVDLSGSEQFGTRGRFKAELAAELAAVLALSAVRNNDRVGLLIFTDRVEHFVPPKKGRRHVLRLIRDVLAFRPQYAGTDLPTALDFAARVLRHRSILFVLSDFIQPPAPRVSGSPAENGRGRADDAPTGTGLAGATSTVTDVAAAATAEGRESRWERTLRLVARRHDLVAINIEDPCEAAIPEAGVLVLVDPETGNELAVNTGDARLRVGYDAVVESERLALQRLFRRLAIDEVPVRTHESYIRPLLAFFRQRERKKQR
jgi:uncharacterized protein (DUF58 family)